MAYLTLEQSDLRQLTVPFMHALCDKYEENIDLTVLDGADVVFINILEGPHRVKLAAAIGQRLPAYATASGKAILGFLPEKSIRSIIELGTPQLTPRTLSTKEQLLANLKSVRELGFSISEQELEEQVNAVAAPILDQHNQPIASIAIAGPAYRLTPKRMLEIGPDLVATTRRISQEITMSVDPQVSSIK
jgi:DNA-binding IclR family transcriptional regulator